MAKSNYFQDMENRYQTEEWINVVSPQDIQKSAVKRIFREMVNGAYDYEKTGKYFLDGRFVENLIVASGYKLEYYTLLNNAVQQYKLSVPLYPNIGAHQSHIQNLNYIYYILNSKLIEVRNSLNISPLIDISPILYRVRNDINNE